MPHFLYLYALLVWGLMAPHGQGSFLPIFETLSGVFDGPKGFVGLSNVLPDFSSVSSLAISASSSSSDISLGSLSKADC